MSANDPFDDYEERPRRRRPRRDPDDEFDDRPRRRMPRDQDYDDDYDDDDDYRPRRRNTGSGTKTILIVLAVVGVVGVLACGGFLFFGVTSVREAAQRMQSSNNMKQMGLAFHNYNDSHGHFPAAAITDKDGKPLLSWRVAILPYIEEDNLYRQFHLDEPWDSPHNRPLMDRMPQVYLHPQDDPSTTSTRYQVIVGPGTMFEPGAKIRREDVLDGTSNTILVVEAADPVPWSKPEDLTYRAGGPLPAFGGDLYDGDGYNVSMADGVVFFWKAGEVDDTTMRSAILRNDGIVIRLP